jgi:hypothetical protein
VETGLANDDEETRELREGGRLSRVIWMPVQDQGSYILDIETAKAIKKGNRIEER